MSYFTRDDHHAVLSVQTGTPHGDAAMQRVYQRMLDLHRDLYPRLKKHGVELYAIGDAAAAITRSTASTPFAADVLTLSYLRERAEAVSVERIMGRDEVMLNGNLEAARHPVIEIRLSPDNLAVELLIAPSAWYDQQNFAGKLSINQHRLQFYQLLARLGSDYLLGFWSGTYISSMHLEIGNLPPRRILFEFMDTFAARRDWLRVGCWYEPEAADLAPDRIASTLFHRLRELYPLYNFLTWSSSNNFQAFYQKMLARA